MIFNFLESVAELITSVLGLIFHAIQMLVMMLLQLPKAITWVLTSITFMPAFVGSVIIISVGIAVIITVVNHWGN